MSDNLPSHDVFHVRNFGEGKSRWLTIGAAWAHKDGKGFTVKLDGVMPLDGTLQLRERQKPAEEAAPPSEEVSGMPF